MRTLSLALLLGLSVRGHAQAETNFAHRTVPISQVVSGKVVRVIDGDTIVILDSTNGQHRVRLVGIDAPEKKQAFSEEAKKLLSDIVFGKVVEVEFTARDAYGRILGKVATEANRWVNISLVTTGLAWRYREQSGGVSDKEWKFLGNGESGARQLRLNIWSVPNPIPPWEWRKREAEKDKPI